MLYPYIRYYLSFLPKPDRWQLAGTESLLKQEKVVKVVKGNAQRHTAIPGVTWEIEVQIYNTFDLVIVCSRCGPTETICTGLLHSSSRRFM
jgi:hypothetical protein